MILQQRIELLVQLGKYMNENGLEWQRVKENAYRENPWFVPEFVDKASDNISSNYLQKNKLEDWVNSYHLPNENRSPAKVGLVMAGNIPMVGFHDLLCVFITGNHQVIKLSSKDEILIRHLIQKMADWDSTIKQYISIADKLNNCEVYIATGSNNSGRYFDYYFGKYPNIIRKNRTSVAVLDSEETAKELDSLADDIQLYFGLGCRNVTKLYVPVGYDFEPLLKVLTKYDYFGDFHKYRHNYDYQLALLMMGNIMYMTNGTTLIVENKSLFTAVSRLNYEVYTNKMLVLDELKNNIDVQCVVGRNNVPFGLAQKPCLNDYADGVDTIRFLQHLYKV